MYGACEEGETEIASFLWATFHAPVLALKREFSDGRLRRDCLRPRLGKYRLADRKKGEHRRRH